MTISIRANTTTESAITTNGTESVVIDATKIKFNLPITDTAGNTFSPASAFAADTGASLIGFKQSGAGAVSTDLNSVLNESISVFRFMTPAQIADVQAGTALLDVTAALQAAADEALASGRFLMGYSGVALVTSTLNLKCSGDLSSLTIKANATLVSPVVRFGTTSGGATTSKNMKLPIITNTARVSGNWGTGIGLEIANADTNTLLIPAVTNFEYGVSIGGYNSGAAYNTIFLGRIYSNKINMRLMPLASAGWSNQNTFVGGRLGINSTDFSISGYVGTRNIVFAKGVATSGGANNNTFINTSVESDLVEYTLEFNESTGFNKLIGLRYEGSSQNVLFHTDTPSGNVYNTFEGGYQVNQLLFTFTGTGSSPYNSILSGAISKMEGTGSVLNIVNNTSNSNIAPHIQGFVAGTRSVSKDHTSTDWAYRLYTQGLEGKRSTDTYARLKMDFNNGRIYFDNGTTAVPTAYIGNLGANGFGFAGTLNPAANSTYTAGSSSFRWSESYVNTMFIGTGTTRITSGSGSPEGVLTASIGSLFTRTDGGAGTTLYVKESGAGNTGWVAKSKESIHIADFGGVADGVTNNSPFLVAARTAANGRKIELGSGTYKFNSAITSGEDLVLEGQGDDTILDFTGATGTYGLDVVGTTTALPDLAIDAVAGARTVQFASAPSLVAGDVFCIYNPANSSWSGFRTNYHAGEWCEVLSVAGTTVNLVKPLYEGYTVASVDLYRMNSPRVSIKNIRVIGTTITGLIKATLCKQPLIENVSGLNANNACIVIDRCYKHRIINPNVVNIGDGGDDYGIAIGNSQHGRTEGGSAYARRHAISYGGNNEVCSVPYRDCVVDGAVISNNPASGTEAADFHGNGEYNEYINCIIDGGGNLQGKNNFYKNCKISNTSSGYVIYHAEVKGGTLGCIGCDFTTTVNPQPLGRGVYDIGGNSVSVTANTVLPTTYLIKDCTIDGKNLTSLTTFMTFENQGSTQKMNIVIDGLVGNVNALNAILRTDLSSGTADSNFIIVDRISGFNTGAALPLHNAAGGFYLTFPHRLQKQTGSVTLSAASGTSSTIAAPINFKYTYPRAPAAHATSVGSVNGNRMAYATLFSNTGTAIRPMIESGDQTTWTVTNDRVVNWTASLDEV